MLDFLIKVTTRFKFWDRLLVIALVICVTAIGIRQGFKPYLPPSVRSILKETHIIAGITMATAALFHGVGHTGILMKIKRKRDQK